MKPILLLLLIILSAYSTQWQNPNCLNVYIDGPSFNSLNNRIYCDIFYSYYLADIAYYDWDGTQWIYIGRVEGDVNTSNYEEEPFLTYDGLHLYFMRSLSQTPPPSYIYVADWNGLAL